MAAELGLWQQKKEYDYGSMTAEPRLWQHYYNMKLEWTIAEMQMHMQSWKSSPSGEMERRIECCSRIMQREFKPV